jgi:hypothetical protein
MAFVNRVFPVSRTRFSSQDFYMPQVPLRSLHACKIEVRVSINDLIQRFRGVGCYEADEKLGNVLRIDVTDNAGGFSLLLQEGASKCVIKAASEADLDYHLQL